MKRSAWMSFILMMLLGAGVALAQEEPAEGAAVEEAGEEVVLETEELSELPLAEEAVVEDTEAPTASVAAAEEEVPSGALAALFGVLKWVLGATGLTLIAQFLKQRNVASFIPGWAKPLIGPALGVLAALASQALGFGVDLSIIEGALLGTTSAVIFDGANAIGVLRGSSS